MHLVPSIAGNRTRPCVVALVLGLVGSVWACAPATREAAEPVARPGMAEPAGGPVSRDVALLTFDSVWSRIANTYYDTAFNGLDWAGVRDELRPSAESAATLDELRRVIGTMLARLGESHFGLIPRDAVDAEVEAGAARGGEGDVGAELRLVEDALVVWRVDPGSPADAAGLRPGTRVVAIDEFEFDGLIAELATLPAIRQRNARTRLLYMVNARLAGPPGSTVALRLEAGRAVVEQRLVRRPQPGELVRFGNLPAMMAELKHERLESPSGCVGLIRLNVWVAQIVPRFFDAVDAVRDCTGIVVDVRGNPGGVAGTIMGTAGHFFSDTVSLGFMRQRGTELRFRANPRTVRADGSRVTPFAGPVAVLVDEMSASTSEFFAGGLQGVGRARVFGTATAGQALPAMLVRLPTQDILMHVVADFTGPGGVRIEGRGVVPDSHVPLRRDDLVAGIDAPLRDALDWIAGSASGNNPNGGRSR